MSAMYTESVFAFFSFKGLRYCYGSFLPGTRFGHRTLPRFQPRYTLAVLCFAMATLARSNGVLLGEFQHPFNRGSKPSAFKGFNFGYVELIGILSSALERRRQREWISLKALTTVAARTLRFFICFVFSAVVPYGA